MPPNQRANNAPSQGQRPGNYAPGGPRPFPAQRTGGTATPTYRQGNAPYQTRSTPPTGAPAQQGGHTTQRPNNGRGNGPARSGAQNQHPTGARPGNWSGTHTQRSQERRAPVVKEKPTGPVSIPPQIMVKDLAELLKRHPQ